MCQQQNIGERGSVEAVTALTQRPHVEPIDLYHLRADSTFNDEPDEEVRDANREVSFGVGGGSRPSSRQCVRQCGETMDSVMRSKSFSMACGRLVLGWGMMK
jgi:hypothetical protein